MLMCQVLTVLSPTHKLVELHDNRGGHILLKKKKKITRQNETLKIETAVHEGKLCEGESDTSYIENSFNQLALEFPHVGLA